MQTPQFQQACQTDDCICQMQDSKLTVIFWVGRHFFFFLLRILTRLELEPGGGVGRVFRHDSLNVQVACTMIKSVYFRSTSLVARVMLLA